VAVLSCIGDDAGGQQIIDELATEGVDTTPVVAVARASSGFTYIIVNPGAATRTCLHTPGTCGDLTLADIDEGVGGGSGGGSGGRRKRSSLDDAWLLHCDSRHTVAAIAAAKLAAARGILISVDVGKSVTRIKTRTFKCNFKS
jgi:sugar/nucleoside kinase (ribokinase family)